MHLRCAGRIDADIVALDGVSARTRAVDMDAVIVISGDDVSCPGAVPPIVLPGDPSIRMPSPLLMFPGPDVVPI
jgi:hypothetical protein